MSITLSADAVLPRIAGALSFMGSAFCVYECGWSQQHSGVVTRCLLAMSILDICSSLAWIVSGWFNHLHSSTCQLQGYLFVQAVGSPLYSAALAVLYYLTIVQGWRSRRLRRLEPFIHWLVWGYATVCALMMIPLGVYNPYDDESTICWLAGVPTGCGNSQYHANTQLECVRGDWAYVYSTVLFYGPIWGSLLLTTCAMVWIVAKVGCVAQRSAQYSTRNGSIRRQVVVQALLLSTASLLTWLPSSLYFAGSEFTTAAMPAGVYWIAILLEPLQGFWNFLIFIRCRKESKRKLVTLPRRVIDASSQRFNQLVSTVLTTTRDRLTTLDEDGGGASTTAQPSEHTGVECHQHRGEEKEGDADEDKRSVDSHLMEERENSREDWDTMKMLLL